MAKFAAAVMWVLREAFVGANDNENENCGRQRTEQRVENIKDFLDVILSRDGRRCNQQEQHKTTLGPQADGDEWSDTAKLMSTDEINNERIMLRNGQELFTHKKSKAEFIKLKQVPDD